MTTIRKSAWNTYRTVGYTFNVGDNPASQGGVHHKQVRKTKSGWQKRICQSNGNHVAYGKPEQISDEEGDHCFAMAENE